MVLALGALARVYHVAHGDAWHDECFTGLVSALPAGRWIGAMLGDVHPPGWYLVSRASVALLGANDLALRLPAMLASLAALVLFWRVLSQLDLAPGPQLAALTLMALSPMQIYYAQEGRMYGALVLAAVLVAGGLALLDFRWVVAGCLLAVYLHNLGWLLFLAGLVGYAVKVKLWRDWWRPWVVPGLLALPAAGWTIYQVAHVAKGYWILDRGLGAWLYNAIYCQYLGQGLLDSRLSWAGSIVSLGLGFAGLVLAIRRRQWVWVVLAWLPGLVMLGVSQVVAPMLLARTLIISSPALYLLAGQLATTRRRQIALVLVVAPLFFSGLYTHYATDRRGDIGQMADQIRAYQPAVVVESQTGAWVTLSWHMPEAQHVVWSGAAHGLSNALSDQTADALGLRRQDLASLPRPAVIINSDYALVSPEERTNIADDLAASGARLAEVLQTDVYQRLELWVIE